MYKLLDYVLCVTFRNDPGVVFKVNAPSESDRFPKSSRFGKSKVMAGALKLVVIYDIIRLL